MQITQITEISKNRSKIFIDFEFAFVLYKGELHIYHIKEGGEISEDDYRTILEEVLPKRAKLRCLNLLKSRDYTREQLKQKLNQGGYPETVIEQALSYVEGYGYVNDEKYAGDYIACYADGKSRMKIEYDLLKKGISKAVIERAWEKWREDGNEQDEEGLVRYWLEKRKWNPQTSDLKERQKTAAFLLRKGFRMETVQKVMKNLDI